MAGPTWTISMNGTAINDGTNFFTTIPEIDNGFSGSIILVPIAGDVPWFHRIQPVEGKYTCLVQMTACAASVYASRLATLKAAFAAGPGTLAVQVRGGASRSIPVISDGGWIIDYQQRRFTAVLTAVQPG